MLVQLIILVVSGVAVWLAGDRLSRQADDLAEATASARSSSAPSCSVG